MKKTTNFKQAEKWGMNHHMNAKQTATMMGNIEDESTGITSSGTSKNYMQDIHENLRGKNMYDYIGKFDARFPAMQHFVKDFKGQSLSKDESYFHRSVEVGKNGDRRVKFTHEFLPQVEKDYKKNAEKHHSAKHSDKGKSHGKAKVHAMNARGRNMSSTLGKYGVDLKEVAKMAENVLQFGSTKGKHLSRDNSHELSK